MAKTSRKTDRDIMLEVIRSLGGEDKHERTAQCETCELRLVCWPPEEEAKFPSQKDAREMNGEALVRELMSVTYDMGYAAHKGLTAKDLPDLLEGRQVLQAEVLRRLNDRERTGRAAERLLVRCNELLGILEEIEKVVNGETAAS